MQKKPMETHENAWNQLEIHGRPMKTNQNAWNQTETHGKPMIHIKTHETK